MKIAVEPLEQCWNEFVTLAAEHWEETEGYRHDQKFMPLFERFKTYEQCGWYFATTVRDNGRLVGYAGMYITPSMHTQELVATEDAWFLIPEYRGGRNGYNLSCFIEDECKKRGAVEITMTANVDSNVGNLLERLGYEKIREQYSKRLRADSALTEESTDVRTEPSAAA